MIRLVVLSLFFLLPLWGVAQSTPLDSLKRLVRVQPEKAILLGRKMLPTTSYSERIEIHFQMGSAFRILGQLENASQHLYLSLSNESLLSNEEKIRNYTELGVVLKQQYKTALALPYYQKALTLAEKTHDNKSYSKLLNNIGRIHFERGDYTEAEYYYRRALVMNSAMQVKSNAILYHNLGAIHEKRELLDSARFYYKKALVGYTEIGDSILLAYGYCSLARTDASLENASELIDKSIAIRLRLGLRADLEESMLVKAELLLKINKTERALQVVDSVEILARETGHKNILLEVLMLKSKMYAKKGNHSQAYLYLKAYSDLQNSEFKAESNRLITGFTSDFKHRQTTQELAFLRSQDSLQQRVILAKNEALSLKNQQTTFYLILLFMAVGGALLLLRILRQLKKSTQLMEIQSRALQESNQEKEVLLKEVNHRVKNNLQIASGIVRRGLDQITNEKARNVIQENLRSVETIAMIHDTIYRQAQLSKISAYQYLNDLSEKTLSTVVQEDDIQLKVEPFEASIDADDAMHLGHLITEWIMNSVKHSRPASGILVIEIGVVEENGYKFLYFRDNGADKAVDLFLKSSNFGNILIRSAVRKISGKDPILNDENGFELKCDISTWYEK